MQSLGSRFCTETEGNLKGSFAQLKLFFISAFSGSAHMVRNHQDGYPYLNLSFFFLKIYRSVNFFGKIDWSMNSGPQ